jgi:ABC-2 type transport system ATP-binding protein
LSKGNRQKVGIVLAFLDRRTELLLLDEPTSGLDPFVQQEFHAIVRERADTGAAVILSSHVLSEWSTSPIGWPLFA